MTTSHLRNSVNRSPLPHGWLVILVAAALVCFALAPVPKAFGVSPPPGGGYSNGNTAEGSNALFSLTTGIDNTALGFNALFHNTTGYYNTAGGYQALFSNATGVKNTADGFCALYSNTTGYQNTATGFQALYNNTIGYDNTAVGIDALFYNTVGVFNTATGYLALYKNATGGYNTATGVSALQNNRGSYNTANGYHALYGNITGLDNVAIGFRALESNTVGNNNTATGDEALLNNTTGWNNTAIGIEALLNNTNSNNNTAIGISALENNTTGNNNTAIGFEAGLFATTGSGNVYIGANTEGTDGESNHTYIANINSTSVSGDTVTVDLITGLLGHLSSSRRYKEDIKPMDKASEVLFALKPVTYRYKKEIDSTQSLDYGLIAEEVAQIDPNLAARDGKGQIETVRYNAVNAMLLNEFLKEHRKVAQLEATVAQQQKDFQSELAEQQNRINVLASGLEKVTAELATGRVRPTGGLALSKAAPRTVLNGP